MNPLLENDADLPLTLLTGIAVADALGFPWEFRHRGSFCVHTADDLAANNYPAGTWSDDTSMTLALAHVMLESRCNLQVIADSFAAWQQHAAYTPSGVVVDEGLATRRAIDRFLHGTPAEYSGGTGERDNGNGSLMRIAPMTFWPEDGCGPGARDRRRDLIGRVSAITHAHPWSITACVIHVEYLDLLRSGLGKHEAYDALRARIAGDGLLDAGDLRRRFARVIDGDIRDLKPDEISGSGFVIHTLEASLWCLLTTDDYASAVVKAVNLGEDTDTTAAVTGAMAALVYGMGSIPLRWRRQLLAPAMIASAARRLAGWDKARG